MLDFILVATLLPITFTVIKAIALGWIFYRVRAIAILIYLIYIIVFPIINQLLSFLITNTISTGQIPSWLGASSGEQAANLLFLSRILSAATETPLFIWLLISLSRRIRRL